MIHCTVLRHPVHAHGFEVCMKNMPAKGAHDWMTLVGFYKGERHLNFVAAVEFALAQLREVISCPGEWAIHVMNVAKLNVEQNIEAPNEEQT